METNRLLIIASLLIGIVALASVAYLGSQLLANVNRLSSQMDLLKNTIESTYGYDLELLYNAAEEGTLTFYFSGPMTGAEKYMAKFEERFPFIDVQIYRSHAGDIWNRYITEFDAGQYICDVFCMGAQAASTWESELLSRGMILNYTPTYAGMYPPEFTIPGYAYPHGVSQLGIVYNTERVTVEEAELLKSWDGLTNPVFNGRFSITWPGAMGTAYLGWYILFEDYADTYGRQWAEEVAANNAKIYTSASSAFRDMVRGEIDVAIMYDTICFTEWESGAPIKWVYPSPTPTLENLSGISAEAPHPNAAKLFYDFLLSPEGQRWVSSEVGQALASGVEDQRAAAKEDWFEGPTVLKRPEDDVVYFDKADVLVAEFNEIFDYIV